MTLAGGRVAYVLREIVNSYYRSTVICIMLFAVGCWLGWIGLYGLFFVDFELRGHKYRLSVLSLVLIGVVEVVEIPSLILGKCINPKKCISHPCSGFLLIMGGLRRALSKWYREEERDRE